MAGPVEEQVGASCSVKGVVRELLTANDIPHLVAAAGTNDSPHLADPGHTCLGAGGPGGGGGGDSSRKCPDVCVGGLKMHPL